MSVRESELQTSPQIIHLLSEVCNCSVQRTGPEEDVNSKGCRLKKRDEGEGLTLAGELLCTGKKPGSSRIKDTQAGQQNWDLNPGLRVVEVSATGCSCPLDSRSPFPRLSLCLEAVTALPWRHILAGSPLSDSGNHWP